MKKGYYHQTPFCVSTYSPTKPVIRFRIVKRTTIPLHHHHIKPISADKSPQILDCIAIELIHLFMAFTLVYHSSRTFLEDRSSAGTISKASEAISLNSWFIINRQNLSELTNRFCFSRYSPIQQILSYQSPIMFLVFQ